MIKRPAYQVLHQRVSEKRGYIQVLLGPRQVGKTTLALQIAEDLNKPCHYVSADIATLQDLNWIKQQWDIARLKVDQTKGCLLIIDEVQKIPNWSDVIKKLWDEDTKNKLNLQVIILGSSPWLMQKGLTESLAGRFEVIPITHWTYQEMHDAFGWSIDEFIYFGGYPGSAQTLINGDEARFMNYINDSLIETTISRDILLMTQVNKPVLLRRLFQLGCNYSSQILSFTKMLGELHESGNTTTLAHYLDLLSGASLITGLQKYAPHMIRQKASSPKFMVYNNALMSAQSFKTFEEAKNDKAFWGRLVESACGAYLLNAARGTPVEVFYWREDNLEVDFILKKGDQITAIEIKSGDEGISHTGLDAFIEKFNPKSVFLVGKQGLPLEEFLKTPLNRLI